MNETHPNWDTPKELRLETDTMQQRRFDSANLWVFSAGTPDLEDVTDLLDSAWICSEGPVRHQTSERPVKPNR